RPEPAGRLQRAAIDVGVAQPSRPVAREMEDGNADLVVLEEARPEIAKGAVHPRAQVDRRLPAEVVVDVGPPRDPDVEVPKAAGAIRGEEEELPVARQLR